MTLLLSENVVYEHGADTRGDLSPPVEELLATVIAQIIVGLFAVSDAAVSA